MTPQSPNPEQLTRTLDAVGRLVAGIEDEDQWSAPTPCTDWTVRELVVHLVDLNRLFARMMNDQAPPDRSADPLGADPVGAYLESAESMQAAFDQPGILDRLYDGPRGPVTGAVRLQWRMSDLLTHGWDLAQATGQPAELPEDLAEQALSFVRGELATQPRDGRFGPAQPVADDAAVTDRLAAFLGRPVTAGKVLSD
ncbi:MAG TPA: TIGR03086 family metal-binding protein [Kribbella sp.]|nr:TIGR03086 family metal-binding protein [Kribbella sp.]